MAIFILTLKQLAAARRLNLCYICLVALLMAVAGLLGAYFLYEEGAIKPIRILVVNDDKSREAGLFLGMIMRDERYGRIAAFEELSDSREAVRRASKGGDAAAAILIPEGFARDVMNGENSPFSIAYNEETPAKASLVRIASEAFMRTLKYSQIGIYATDAYTAEFFPEKAAEVNRFSNLKYIGMLLGRGTAFDEENVAVTGAVSAAAYYAACFYIFLALAGIPLFVKVVSDNFSASKLRLFRMRGISKTKLCTLSFAALFCFFALQNAAVIAGAAGLSRLIGLDLSAPPESAAWLALSLSAALAAVCVAFAALRLSELGAAVFSFLNISALFFSGGIIPRVFLSPLADRLGDFTLNRLLMEIFLR